MLNSTIQLLSKKDDLFLIYIPMFCNNPFFLQPIVFFLLGNTPLSWSKSFICIYLNLRKLVEMQHCYFMELRKQMREGMPICSVDARIFPSFIDGLRFKCTIVIYSRHKLAVCPMSTRKKTDLASVCLSLIYSF